jgi:two-component system sensor histidine kinase KdpD
MDGRARLILRIAASVGLIAAVTALYALAVHVNPTTIALTYLVVILLLAGGWGIAVSTTASIVAVLCFNFFFLPPVGTFTIADPQNWVALIAFLITAIVTSQLSGHARQRTDEALARQRDLERLYALSRSLLLAEGGASLPGAIARHIADAFDLPSVGLFDQRADTVSFAGPLIEEEMPGIEIKLREVARRGIEMREPGDVVVTAIQLGGAPIGSLAVKQAQVSDTVLHSIVNLAAIGLERARAEEAAARAEAARQSGELRATVLDALAHEFKTPLTSMKAAAGNLLTSTSMDAGNRELVTIVNEELDRLQGLVTDAVRMLRIDAGDFAIHLDRQNVAAMAVAVLAPFERRLEGHEVHRRVPEGLTVDADGELLSLAIRQLLDNALKYSPANSTIEIRAREVAGMIKLSVYNSGSDIPEREQARVFERFYRGSHSRHVPGTGMGLAIVQQIAEAHGGALTVRSSPDAGTEFIISIPPSAGSIA